MGTPVRTFGGKLCILGPKGLVSGQILVPLSLTTPASAPRPRPRAGRDLMHPHLYTKNKLHHW